MIALELANEATEVTHWSIGLITALGAVTVVVLGAITGLLKMIYDSRRGDKKQSAEQVAAEKKEDLNAVKILVDAIVKPLQLELTEARSRITLLEGAHERVRILELETALLRQEVSDLRSYELLLQECAAYIEILLDWIDQNITIEQTALPSVPASIAAHFKGEFK